MENIKYCFLKALYVDCNNVIIGYSLVFSSTDFSNVYEEIVPSAEIMEVLKCGYVYDFGIDADILKCNEVPRVTSCEADLGLFSVKRRVNFDDNSIYSFILEGIAKDYLIIDDTVLECEEYVGGAIAKFNMIQIAKSTMSMYVNMYDDSNIYHQTLMYLHDGILELKPFYVAVPLDKPSLNYELVESNKRINNELYNVYIIKDVPVYTTAMITCPALINKAVQMSLRYNAMIAGVEDYLKTIRQAIGDQGKSYNWVHSGNSLKSSYGVYFESSMRKLDKKQRENVLNTLITNVFVQASTFVDALEMIKGLNMTTLQKCAAAAITQVFYNTDTVADSISLGMQYISELRFNKLKIDLFLYRIRVTSYVMRIPLVNKRKPMLIGSDESEFTLVQACNYYGEVNQ